MNFDSLPEVGFAMQHYSKSYRAGYGNIDNKCVEIAYINSGTVKVKYNKTELIADEGDILILFRHLPIFTETVGDKHVPFGVLESIYSEKDVAILLKLLYDNGYLKQNPCTVTFEVRPEDGVSGKDTWNHFYRIWQESITGLM